MVLKLKEDVDRRLTLKKVARKCSSLLEFLNFKNEDFYLNLYSALRENLKWLV